LDGTLYILENIKKDGLTNTERYLANKHKEVDTNGDGKITPDEMKNMIARFQQGKSTYSEEKIYELIDLFFED
jgi:Ca2+-binding EF-hand superfamily protein